MIPYDPEERAFNECEEGESPSRDNSLVQIKLAELEKAIAGAQIGIGELRNRLGLVLAPARNVEESRGDVAKDPAEPSPLVGKLNKARISVDIVGRQISDTIERLEL